MVKPIKINVIKQEKLIPIAINDREKANFLAPRVSSTLGKVGWNRVLDLWQSNNSNSLTDLRLIEQFIAIAIKDKEHLMGEAEGTSENYEQLVESTCTEVCEFINRNLSTDEVWEPFIRVMKKLFTEQPLVFIEFARPMLSEYNSEEKVEEQMQYVWDLARGK